MIMVLFGLFLMFFYNSVMGLPATLVGIAVSAGLAIDAVVDPYIGYRSDFLRHPWGRRLPFMLFGSLAMGPSFYLLLAPPRSLSGTSLFIWLLIASIVFRFVSAVYRIPYLSLGAELSSDYHERTQIIGIRSLFGLLGTLLAAGMSFAVFFPDSGGAASRLQYEAYPRIGLVFGVLMTVFGLAAVWGTRQEARDIPASHRPQTVPVHEGVWSGIRQSLANFNFRVLWFSFLLFFLAVVLNATLAVHFFTWFVKLDRSAVLSSVQSAFYVGALAGVPVWMALSKRLEKAPLYVAGALGTGGVVALAGFLFGEGSLFGTGDAVPLIAGHAIAGAVASSMWILPASMIADIVDDDELKYGIRREGLFFGVLNFGEKIAAGAAVLLSGLLLNFYVGLAPGSATQSPQVVSRIGVSFGLVPALILFLSALLVLPYRLRQGEVERIQAALNPAEGKNG